MTDGTAVLEEDIIESPSHGGVAPVPTILGGIPEARGVELPSWFRDQQLAAWQLFESLPAPRRTDQPWRFSNVAALDLSPYLHGQPLSDLESRALVEQSIGLEEIGGRLVFADGQLIERTPLTPELERAGVVFAPIASALQTHEALFREHFMTQPAVLGSAKFAALHRALLRDGSFLFVPRGVQVELPLEAFHWLHGESAAAFPHTLLIAEANAQVTFIEHFRSSVPERGGFACGVNDLFVGDGAKVTYICAQDWGENVLALQMNSTVVGRDASAMSLNLNLGAAISRVESLSRLTAPGGRSDMLAVSVANEQQEFDLRTLQDHTSPQTASDLLYKNALTDRSRAIFGGLIRVEPHAHFTDAYQTVRNLLLTDDAEANSMPGLEILADNVKCSHGATTGQIDAEEMFYLLARGIAPAVARQLLVSGFLNEVTARLQQPKLESALHRLIEQKFARM